MIENRTQPRTELSTTHSDFHHPNYLPSVNLLMDIQTVESETDAG